MEYIEFKIFWIGIILGIIIYQKYFMKNDFLSAIEVGDVKMIKELLKQSKWINRKDFKMRTALHIAVLKKYYYIAQLLIEYGIDTNAKDKDEKTALDYAIQSDQHDLVNLLSKKQQIDKG